MPARRLPACLAVLLGGALLCGSATADEVILDGGAVSLFAAPASFFEDDESVSDGKTHGKNKPGDTVDARVELAEGIAASEVPESNLTVTYAPVQVVPSLLDPLTPVAAQTRHQGISSAIMAAKLGTGANQWWRPTLNYSAQLDNGLGTPATLGDAAPVSSTSLTSHDVSLEWALGDVRLGTRGTRSDRYDSREGHSILGSRTIGRSTYLGVVSEELGIDLQLETSTDQARDTNQGDQDLSRARTNTLSAIWHMAPRMTLSSSYAESRSGAARLVPETLAKMADITFTYALGNSPHGSDGTQFYIRLERQSLQGLGGGLALVPFSNSWGVSAGLIIATF